MKRLFKIIFLLFILLVDTRVFAKEVSLVCPSSVKAGNTFTCTIRVNYNLEYGCVEGVLSYSDGLTYKKFSKSYSNGEVYGNKFSFYDVDLKKGSTKAGTISFTLKKGIKEKQTITLSNILLFDADSRGIEVNSVSSVIKVDTSVDKSSSASKGSGSDGTGSSGSGSNNETNSSQIKKLIINNDEVDLKKDITEYEITVNNIVTKLDIDVSLEDDSSKYEVKGNDNLQVGENLVSIVVTPKQGKAITYKIKVNRLVSSSNSLLESIIIKGHKIKFNSNKFEYTIYLDNGVNSLDIDALPIDKNAFVVIGGNKDLNMGDFVSIVVQAEDGTTSMYVLKIIEKNVLIYLCIGGVFIIILLIILFVMYMRRKKKNNQIFMDLQ